MAELEDDRGRDEQLLLARRTGDVLRAEREVRVLRRRSPRRLWVQRRRAKAERRPGARALSLRRRCGCRERGRQSVLRCPRQSSPRSSATPSATGLYENDDLGALPDAAKLASLGCGNPTAVADLHEGETVLDLGSGGGIDVLLSAEPGRAQRKGLRSRHDRRDARARPEQPAGGQVENAEFLKGTIEDIPLPDDSVDVIISNCVINLSGDKPSVFREASRVLRPGGRFAVSDVVADPDMDEATRADMEQWTGCIAGALTRDDFDRELQRGRVRRHRDHRDSPRSRERSVSDHSRSPERLSDGRAEIQLNDPQTLYRRWEDQQWNPFEIDLERDREQWQAMEPADQELIYWVLASLMVAEERITTKFSGLVGAHGSEEEATFLSTQQVDEARHMQFYARFQDEVVAEPATVAAHVERARREVTPAFRKIFDEALVEAHEQLVAAPGDLAAQGPLRDDLPPDPREHPRPHDVPLRDRVPRARVAPAGLRRGLLADPPRRDPPHRLRRLVPPRERSRASRGRRGGASDAPRPPAVGRRGARRMRGRTARTSSASASRRTTCATSPSTGSPAGSTSSACRSPRSDGTN